MLAVLIGYFSIFLGLLIVLLPALIAELSRPKDAVLGAMIMSLGLILITSNRRFDGSPMFAVILSSIVISRLLLEVSQYRWQQLSSSEKIDLKKISHWKNNFNQLFLAFLKLGSIFVEFISLFKPKPKPSSIGKKWVSPELREGNSSSEIKQGTSPEVKIEKNNLVSDQLLSQASEDTTQDAS